MYNKKQLNTLKYEIKIPFWIPVMGQIGWFGGPILPTGHQLINTRQPQDHQTSLCLCLRKDGQDEMLKMQFDL